MPHNPTLILIILLLVLVFIKFIILFTKGKLISINEIVLDMYYFFLCICGIYAGFSVSYYGIFRKPLPGSDINFFYCSLAVGGVIIILISLGQMKERMTEKKKYKIQIKRKLHRKPISRQYCPFWES